MQYGSTSSVRENSCYESLPQLPMTLARFMSLGFVYCWMMCLQCVGLERHSRSLVLLLNADGAFTHLSFNETVIVDLDGAIYVGANMIMEPGQERLLCINWELFRAHIDYCISLYDCSNRSVDVTIHSGCILKSCKGPTSYARCIYCLP